MFVGRFSIKLYNFARKSRMTGSGAGSNVVSSYGEATKMAGLAKVGKSRPRKGAEGQTLEGIGVAFSRLPKNVSNDPSFFFFPSLSRLSCVSADLLPLMPLFKICNPHSPAIYAGSTIWTDCMSICKQDPYRLESISATPSRLPGNNGNIPLLSLEVPFFAGFS